MKNSVFSDYSQLLLLIYRQAQEFPVDEFQDRVLDTVKSHLPFDSSMWGTARVTDSGIDIHTLHLYNTTPAMIEAYEKVKHLDYATKAVTALPRRTLSWNAENDFMDPHLRPLKEFLHEFGHENVFITSDIHPITRFAQWVSLYRSEKSQFCTSEELELLEHIAPHLMQALAINRLVHLDRVTGDIARELWAVAIADNRGVLYHADPRFRTLLNLEWPQSVDEKLPQPLLDEMEHERHQMTGRRIVVKRTAERGLLFLKARERAPVDDLTAREHLVAGLLLGGLTHKEVAVKLERSPETIRTQIRAIFAKLGISKLAMLGPLLALRE